jgi:hypothetical protein
MYSTTMAGCSLEGEGSISVYYPAGGPPQTCCVVSSEEISAISESVWLTVCNEGFQSAAEQTRQLAHSKR